MKLQEELKSEQEKESLKLKNIRLQEYEKSYEQYEDVPYQVYLNRQRLEKLNTSSYSDSLLSEKLRTPTKNLIKKEDNTKMRDSDFEYNVQAKVDEALLAKEVAKRLEAVESYGDDNYPDNTVVKFTKKFDGNDTVYVYVALKVGETWYVTSKREGTSTFTWNQFRNFLAKPVAASKLVVGVFDEGTTK